MTQEQLSLERIMSLRKLTRAIADTLRERMLEYFGTLAPLFRPRAVLGDYVKGATRENVRGAERNFKDLEELHASVVTAAPYTLRIPLATPIEVESAGLEITPLEYYHDAIAGGTQKSVLVRSPLRWVLSFPGVPLSRLRELLDGHRRAPEDLHSIVIHYLLMHMVVTRQPGLADLMAALRFPVETITLPEFGRLPITCVTTAVTTIRPSDDVILKSTEFSGMDAFEEYINLADLAALGEPYKEEMIALARAHGEDPGASAAGA